MISKILDVLFSLSNLIQIIFSYKKDKKAANEAWDNLKTKLAPRYSDPANQAKQWKELEKEQSSSSN